MKDFQAKLERERPRVQRGKLLLVLCESCASEPSGHISGESARKWANMILPGPDQIASDAEALALLRSLVEKGYLAERRKTLDQGEGFRLQHCSYTTTAAGRALYEKRVPPDASVDNGQVYEE